MQAAIAAAGKIKRVMFETAAHEDEVLLDPIRNTEPENVGEEFRGQFRIRRVVRHMAEFVHGDAPHLGAGRGECPLRKQLDLPSIGIAESQGPGYSGQAVGAEIRRDTDALQALAHIAQFGLGTDLKGHGLAARDGIFLKHEAQLPGFRGEPGATILPVDHAEPDDRLIVFDLRLDIRRRKCCVPNTLNLNHRTHLAKAPAEPAPAVAPDQSSRVMMILPSALPESKSSCAWRTAESLKRAEIAGLMAPSARWPIMRFMIAR